MVKKSKRKQTVVPFEKTISAVVVNVSPFTDIVGGERACGEVNDILQTVILLSECDTLADQMKLLQERKGVLKKILTKEFREEDVKINEICISLLLHLLLDPKHMWLKKNLEWLTDGVGRTTLLHPNALRLCVRQTCLKFVDMCVASNDMIEGSVDTCFGWVYTFQWMYMLDRELSWLDDGSLQSGEVGCWQTSVWPAAQDIGNGTMLRILEAIAPLLRRCAAVISSPAKTHDGPAASHTTSEIMRHGECVGECMRVLSALLKSRRGAIISPSPVTTSGHIECDSWDGVTKTLMASGCAILGSETVSKDVLTSTALVVIGIQWLLRVRLWERGARALSEKCPNQKNKSAAQDWSWGDFAPCAGLQLIAILSLLRLCTGATSQFSGPASEVMGNASDSISLIIPFARVVGVSSELIASLSDHLSLSALSKCAIFRACLSVFDSGAVMYHPAVSDPAEGLSSAVSFLSQVRDYFEHELDGFDGQFATDTNITLTNLQQIALVAVSSISNEINSSIVMSGSLDSGTSRSQASGILLGVMFDLTIYTCLESSSPVVRVYGLQTMESWLGRVDSEKLAMMAAENHTDGRVLGGVQAKLIRENLVSTLCTVAIMLSRAWSHPFKGVSHMVPTVYQRVIDLVSSVDTAMKSRDAVGLPDHVDIWAVFLSSALAQPVEHRGRYQALSILLPKIGGERLLQLNPQIVRSLVLSMRVRDVASSVASFLGTLLRSILADAIRSLRSVRNMYIREVASVMCSPESKLRTNAADYLCPELFNIDPDFGPLVIEEIRNACDQSEIHVPMEHKMWGIVSVVLHARLLTKSGGDIVSESGVVVEVDEVFGAPTMPAKLVYRPVTVHELEWVCLRSGTIELGTLLINLCDHLFSNDIDLRLLGLTVLTASQRVLSPMQPLEMRILQDTLPYSLKSPVADVRQRVLRVLRTLITRLRESYRSSTRDLKKAFFYRHSQIPYDAAVRAPVLPEDDASVIAAALADKAASEAEKSCASISSDVMNCMEWLNHIIMANFYPGAPNDREIMALEMLRCVYSGITGNIGSGVAYKSKNSHCTAPVDKDLEITLLSPFHTEQMINSLLNLLISSWDPTRALAADLLLAMPKPLPGYTTPAKVSSLWLWGSRLMGSAKQRESDSGALIVRVVMSIYCLQLRWKLVPTGNYDEALPLDSLLQDSSDVSSKLQLVPPTEDRPTQAVTNDVFFDGTSEAQEYVLVICAVLDSRLRELSAVFDALSGNTTVHSLSVAHRDISIENIQSKSEDTPSVNFASSSSGAWSSDVLHVPLSAIPAMPTHLSHGGMLALKYCLVDLQVSGSLLPNQPIASNRGGKKPHLDKQKGNSSKNPAINKVKTVVHWRPVAKRILELAQAGLKTSLQIVAESPVDNFFAPVPLEGASKNHILQNEGDKASEGTKGNTRGYASDSFMLNTNVFMDLVEGDEGGTGSGVDDSIGVRMQRAVVGAWLLVKESCSLLAKLVQLSVSMTASSDCKGESPAHGELLTTSEISTVGYLVLDAISRLKHNGAIAEAQSALQSICESIMGNGSNNVALASLPAAWLDSLINKLKGEQQIFILRRSAGFAFSFLSLLRSEPKNCRPVMLPIAMAALFDYASRGSKANLLETENTDDMMAGDAWRSVVHALNIIRLIILDSTLGPDLHPYIPQATMIAVKGFKSPLWAIRNSSMMVFSAVVQRTVDNDKRESGGIRAATASDYFNRFPSLFPFLLSELADITGATLEMDEKDWPLNVVIPSCGVTPSYAGTGPTHPSLYPILLMLSKMRTEILEPMPADVSSSEDEGIGLAASATCDIGLFAPLVQMCASQSLFQVRVVASKALSALVPLQQTPTVVERILKKITSSFHAKPATKENPSSRGLTHCVLTSNLFHGMLLQIHDLMNNLRKHMQGGSAEMGNNRAIFAVIERKISDMVVPQVIQLQQAIIAVAVEAERQYRKQKMSNTASNPFDLPFAPVILLTFKRVVKLVYDVVPPSLVTTELLVRTCEMNIAVLIAGVSERGAAKAEADALQFSRIPFTPLLWKECLTDLVDISFFLAMEKKSRPATKKIISYGEPVEEVPADVSPKKPVRVSPSLPIFALMRLLNHPISEVREGILLGSINALSRIISSSKPNVSIRADVSKYLELTLAPGSVDENSQDAPVEFILALLRRCLVEREPPILEVTMQLLASISQWTAFESIASVWTREACVDAVPCLLKIACGLHSPESMLDFLDPTVHNASVRDADDAHLITPVAPSFVSVSSTATAAYAVEVIGWIVHSFFNQTLKYFKSTSLLTDVKSELLGSKRKGRLAREQDCTINGQQKFRSNSIMSAVESSGGGASQSSVDPDDLIECHDGHVWAWLRLMELGGVGPESGVDIRGAVARCLSSSGALMWSAIHGAVAAPIGSLLGVAGASKHGGTDNGGGDFGCRVWTLALQLMQDDDSDVRSWMNDGVSEAVALLCQVEPQFKDWTGHKLSGTPCLNGPLYSLESTKIMGGYVYRPENICCGGIIGHADEVKSEIGSIQTESGSSPTVQGLAMERLVLPLALSIGWTILQSPRLLAGGDDQDGIIDAIVNPSEGGKVYTADEVIPHLLSSLHSTSIASSGLYIILEKWLDTCGAVERMDEDQDGADVSHKIFEADQSNLFEENSIYSRALSFSLAYNLILLPTHWTVPICIDFVRRAWNAMSTIRKYVKKCRDVGEDEADGWIGGFSYHPEKFEALYNSLSGMAFLCVTVRNPVFMVKKHRVLLEDQKEKNEETAAARSLCVLLPALGSMAKELCRDIRGESAVEDVLKPSTLETKVDDCSTAISLNDRTSALVINHDIHAGLSESSKPVAIHPLIVALLVDIAGPADCQVETTSDDLLSSCMIL